MQENSCRTRRVSLAFERGFHADVTVNNVKRRRSPFYFVHTRSCFLAKMIFFRETNRFSPFQRALLVFSRASDVTDVMHGIPTDTVATYHHRTHPRELLPHTFVENIFRRRRRARAACTDFLCKWNENREDRF